MTTEVHYFGIIAEKIGVNSEQIMLDTEHDSIDLRAYFEQKYPVLIELEFKIAVNQEFVEQIEVGAAPSEIALLPPFAGG